MKDQYKKRIWVSFGIIVLSVVGAAVGLYFLSNNIHAKAAQIIQNRTLLATQTSFLGSLASLKHDAPIAAQYEVAIDRLLPTQYQLISFGQSVNSIAATKGVSVNFSLQGNPIPPQGTMAGTEAFSLNADGSLGSLIAFMNDMETQESAFLLSVSTFDFTSDGTTSHLNIQGNLYFH